MASSEFGPVGLTPTVSTVSVRSEASAPGLTGASAAVRAKFSEWAAGTLFGMLLKQMRQTAPPGKLLHGGRAETIFRSELDATLTQRLATEHGEKFADRLLEQFLRHKDTQTDTQTQAPLHEPDASRTPLDGVPVTLDRTV